MTATESSDPGREAHVLRKLVDNTPALLAYWDRNQRNVVANAAYVEWFGRTPEQIRGMHIRDVLGEDVYRLNLPFIEAAERGEAQHFDRTLVNTAGQVRHTQASYIPEIVNGEVLGFFVLVTDTTAKVEAQRQLDEAQAIAHVGSWVYYPESGELWWSKEMYRLIEADPESDTASIELWKSRIHPDDRERTAAVQGAASLAGRPYEQHYRLVLPSGKTRYVASRGAPTDDVVGGMRRMVGTIQDETDLRVVANELVRANDRLSDNNALLSDTVAMLGHDVRQPIQAVTGFLEFTQDAWSQLTDEQRLDNVRRALDSGLRMRTLVDNILTLMNVESGALDVRQAAVTLSDEVAKAVGAAVPDEEVLLDLDATVVAWVDPFHLRQVLANLLSNAVKYGAPPIEVTVRNAGGMALIEIADHGEGVPEDFLPQLFGRFARAQSGTALTKTGSGFGLYLARSLVQANGGSLTYEPTASPGARFVVAVPLAVSEEG